MLAAQKQHEYNGKDKLRETNFGLAPFFESPQKKSIFGVSEAEKILNDEEAKRKQQEELVLYQGSPIYKKICYQLKLRNRTLFDRFDITDKTIKDDSLHIQLMEMCVHCKGQLIEPKLKKAIMKENLKNDGTFNLVSLPECTFCGKNISLPKLRIVHGRASRTFRKDRSPRHKKIECDFLSAHQIYKKIGQLVKTSRGKPKQISIHNGLRDKEPELFWNLVYYFNTHDLPYDLFLPYQDTAETDKIEQRFSEINANCKVRFKK